MNDSFLNFISMQLFSEISGMNAENNQRIACGESMAYVDEDYYKVSEKYREMWNEYVKFNGKKK